MGDLWLTKPSEEPPAVLAATLVEKYDLTPPVDIENLTVEAADIFEEPWPYANCDAVVVGLQSERPSVYLRRGLHPRRKRFTLAHEYGHLRMAWHVGVVGCKPKREQFEEGPLEPAVHKESVAAWWRLEEQEAEATRFASYLLIPDAFLRPLIGTLDMDEVMRGLDQANVSAGAALMRLRSALQPGFCFVAIRKESVQVFASPGTSLAAVEAGSELSSLTKLAHDSGKAEVGGSTIHWFRLADFTAFEPANDSRSATELIRSAIAAHETDPETREAVYRSINGVVGGSLSKERAQNTTQALAVLRHKFRHHPRYGPITSHPDFDLYLRRKAEEWCQKRGL